ncbi:O-antigen ligase family protein [Nostoc sp.]|uniref:O-antigen ligase family protein n=1 Tax=Nostoc sp. TaxID=1180 RepID=UPI002FF6EA5E
MENSQVKLSRLQIYICLITIFVAGIGESSKYFILEGTGSIIGKLMIGSSNLIICILFPSILTTVGISFIKKEHGINKLALYIFIAVLIVGIFIGIIYPFSTGTPFYPEYYLSDIIIIISPCPWIIAFPYIFKSNKVRIVLKLIIFQCFLIALSLFIYNKGIEKSYVSNLLTSVVMAYIITEIHINTKKFKYYLFFVIRIIAILFLFKLYSLGYQRISLIAFCVIMLISLSIIAFSLSKIKLLILFISGLVLCLFLQFGFGQIINNVFDNASYQFSKSRTYQTLIDKELFSDESSAARINETKDCLDMMINDFPLSLLGYGHGASYIPFLSPIITNATPDGLIHNIHFGPMLLLFRYGIFGIGFYLLLVKILWHGFWRTVIYLKEYEQIPKELLLIYIVAYLNLCGMWVKLHAQNTLVDPMMPICIGIVCTSLNYSTVVTQDNENPNINSS